VSNNLYNILKNFNKLTENTVAPDNSAKPAEKIYESVEPQGSILSGVDRVHAKLQKQFAESDFSKMSSAIQKSGKSKASADAITAAAGREKLGPKEMTRRAVAGKAFVQGKEEPMDEGFGDFAQSMGAKLKGAKAYVTNNPADYQAAADDNKAIAAKRGIDPKTGKMYHDPKADPKFSKALDNTMHYQTKAKDAQAGYGRFSEDNMAEAQGPGWYVTQETRTGDPDRVAGPFPNQQQANMWIKSNVPPEDYEMYDTSEEGVAEAQGRDKVGPAGVAYQAGVEDGRRAKSTGVNPEVNVAAWGKHIADYRRGMHDAFNLPAKGMTENHDDWDTPDRMKPTATVEDFFHEVVRLGDGKGRDLLYFAAEEGDEPPHIVKVARQLYKKIAREAGLNPEIGSADNNEVFDLMYSWVEKNYSNSGMAESQQNPAQEQINQILRSQAPNGNYEDDRYLDWITGPESIQRLVQQTKLPLNQVRNYVTLFRQNPNPEGVAEDTCMECGMLENSCGCKHDMNEGAMRDIDIERQDCNSMSDSEFKSTYKMTKAEWRAKHRDLLENKVDEDYKHKGKAYGGAAQKDDDEADDEDDDTPKKRGAPKKTDSERSSASLPFGGEPDSGKHKLPPHKGTTHRHSMSDEPPRGTPEWPEWEAKQARKEKRAKKIKESNQQLDRQFRRIMLSENFKQIMGKHHMTMDEMVKRLSHDIQSYKTHGKMSDVLRDCMEIHSHNPQIADESALGLPGSKNISQLNPGALKPQSTGIGSKIKDTVKGIMGHDDVEHWEMPKPPVPTPPVLANPWDWEPHPDEQMGDDPEPPEYQMETELNELARLAGLQVADESTHGKYINDLKTNAKAHHKSSIHAFGQDIPVDEGTCPKCGCDRCECNEDTALNGEIGKTTGPDEVEFSLGEMVRLAGIAVEGRDYGDVKIADPAKFDNSPKEQYMDVGVLTKGGDGEVAGKEKDMQPNKPTFKNGDNPKSPSPVKEQTDPLEALGRNLLRAYNSIKLKK
jgi:hypothetical protein